MQNNNQKTILSAIILVGMLIAGAILLKDTKPPVQKGDVVNNKGNVPVTALSPVGAEDKVLGNPEAEITLVLYEDFQCPFCGKFFQESEEPLRDTYVANGTMQIVYRDFAFLGPESERAAEAARCAHDQGKFWEYHDFLFTHQNGENQGNFDDKYLKSFAVQLGLNSATFATCLDTNKYEQAVADAKIEASNAGVNGTPKGFILKNGNLVDTIDGAEPYTTVKAKIESALK